MHASTGKPQQPVLYFCLIRKGIKGNGEDSWNPLYFSAAVTAIELMRIGEGAGRRGIVHDLLEQEKFLLPCPQ